MVDVLLPERGDCAAGKMIDAPGLAGFDGGCEGAGLLPALLLG